MASTVTADEVRAARIVGDPRALVVVLAGRDPTAVLQRAGAALIRMARTTDALAVLAPTMRDVAARARERGEYGDDSLAEDLLLLADGREPEGRLLPLDLHELVDAAADHDSGAYLNRDTGEVVHGALIEDQMEGDDFFVDLEEGDWAHIRLESRDGYEDMADFAAAVPEGLVRLRLENALNRPKPFRHFRDAVYDADLGRDWGDFEEERRYGHLRRLLVRDEGVHPV